MNTWPSHVEDGPDALIFAGAKGAPLRSGNFGRAVKWTRTVTSVGLANFHFHDLRHTGNTLAATSGASTRELMHRMGHATMRAALIYQHATSERDRETASAMDRRIAGEGRRRRRTAPMARKIEHGGEAEGPGAAIMRSTWASYMERATGIEPAPSVWKIALGCRDLSGSPGQRGCCGARS